MIRITNLLALWFCLQASVSMAQPPAPPAVDENHEPEFAAASNEALDDEEDGPFFGLRAPARDSALPPGTLALEWGLGLEHPQADTVIDFFYLGVGYGLVDRLEVGAYVIPLTLGLFESDLDYYDPSLYARYLILRGDHELSLTLAGSIPTGDEPAEIGVALIGAVGVGDFLLEYGFEWAIGVGEGAEVGLEMPARAYYSVSDHLYFMLGTGFVTENLKETSRAWALPLASELGVTFGDERPVFDLSMGLTFPRFVNDGGIGAEAWTIELAGRAYFWL